MLENRRDAALGRRAKLLDDIAAVEAGLKLSKPVFVGERQSDAKQNHLTVLRQVLADEEAEIAVINEDLGRSAS